MKRVDLDRKRSDYLNHYRNSLPQPDDRLSALVATTNADVNFTRTELYFFLGILAFIAVTTLGIGDRELLIGTRAKLPLLDISIDLEQFLAVSPLAILATSFVLFLKFSKIRRKFARINELLDEVRSRSRRDARSYELRLTSNFITQWLVRSTDHAFEQRLSLVIYLFCLLILPLFCQLFIIVRTLPLHSEAITTFQIATLTLQLWLIVYFHSRSNLPKAKATIISILSGLILGLIFSVPDSRLDRWGTAIWPTNVPIAGKDEYFRSRRAFFPTAILLESGVDSQTRRPILWFSRNLVVRFSQQIPDVLQQPPNQQSLSSVISLRGRNLRYAVLSGSDLRGVDFTLADLTGATLTYADLRNAKFGCVTATNPSSYFTYVRARFGWSTNGDEESSTPSQYNTPAACTTLANVDFSGSDLRGISIETARYTKPSFADLRFSGANLAGVDLSQVNISRSVFYSANLSGVKFNRARGVGAIFAGAILLNADLGSMDGRLANFSSSHLIGTDLSFANLSGAIFINTWMLGTKLSGTNLTASNFVETVIWRTELPQDSNLLLSWANFDQLQLRQPTSVEVDYWKRTLAGLQLATNVEKDLIASAQAPNWSSKQWLEVGSKLKRDENDATYQAAYTKFVVSYACLDNDFLLALVRNVSDRVTVGVFYYSDSWPSELKRPDLPPDPAIAKLPALPPKGFYSTQGFEPYGPLIPIWFDHRLVSNTLTTDKCLSTKSMRAAELSETVSLFNLYFDLTQKKGG